MTKHQNYKKNLLAINLFIALCCLAQSQTVTLTAAKNYYAISEEIQINVTTPDPTTITTPNWALSCTSTGNVTT